MKIGFGSARAPFFFLGTGFRLGRHDDCWRLAPFWEGSLVTRILIVAGLASCWPGAASAQDGMVDDSPPSIFIDPMESQRHLEREQSKRILADTLAIMQDLETVIGLSPEAARAIMGGGSETEMLRNALHALQQRSERKDGRVERLMSDRVESAVNGLIGPRIAALEERVKGQPVPSDDRHDPGAAVPDETNATVSIIGAPSVESAEDLDSLVTARRARNQRLSVESMTLVNPIRIAIKRLLNDGVSSDITVVRIKEAFNHDGNRYQVLKSEMESANMYRMKLRNMTTGEEFDVSYFVEGAS